MKIDTKITIKAGEYVTEVKLQIHLQWKLSIIKL